MKNFFLLLLVFFFSSLGFAQSKCKQPVSQHPKYAPLVFQSTDYTCGPAALLSLLRFWRIEKYQEMDLPKILGTTVKDGTLPNDFTKGLKALGLHGGFKTGLTLQDLQNYFAQGKGVIPLIDDEGDHWVLVVDFQKDQIVTMNPWPTICDYSSYSKQSFEKNWQSKFGNKAALIIEKP
jgi:predicted double-glycine peptidase